MRNILFAILLLPGLANADDWFQIRHATDTAGANYVVVRATNPIASAIMTTLVGYSCLVTREASFTGLSPTWIGVSAAAQASKFTLTAEQQSFCADAPIPDPAPITPEPQITSLSADTIAYSGSPDKSTRGQPIGKAPKGTVCGDFYATFSSVDYFSIHFIPVGQTNQRSGIVVCQ